MIHTANDAIIQDYGTFVVGTRANLEHLDRSPFGLDLRWELDPTRQESATFLALLQRLDALTFGPEGMPMDLWVFYDCAELPGFIYGFAIEASRMTTHERVIFDLPVGYDGPVPLSMYIAIPMAEPGAWFGHNLASLNLTFPERRLQALGTMTKAMAIKAYRTERLFGATQWTSRALYIHTKFGVLDLHTTWTPAHSIPATLTYAFDVTEEKLRAAAGDPAVRLERPEPDFYLDAEDTDGMQALQAQIEGGAAFQLVGPPSVQRGRTVHPLRRSG
ncbi:MAG: hypothetical protein H6744_03490 [Deltaproteobacteria bacterium]|nr:hypothetical protein [Deltaproteobacteria bacterium]MCB9785740.1 hypothetical protein [Deltaproteobacteria bacterium]